MKHLDRGSAVSVLQYKIMTSDVLYRVEEEKA